MKFFHYVAGIFIFLITLSSNAYVITDVRTFDAFYPPNYDMGTGPHWTYNLADYGFLPDRDRLVGKSLRLEIRDPDYHPGEDWTEHPFITVYASHARLNGYATDKDWVTRTVPFDEEGLLPLYITIYDSPGIWLGKVTLTLEIEPGPTAVTEAASFSLIAIGFLALAFARNRNN